MCTYLLLVDGVHSSSHALSLINRFSKHGTYRPNLANLVASNSLQDVRKVTKDAFAIYGKDNANYAKAITALSKLKGIGPATASLMLASYDPVNVPFFSDELFRYLHWSDAKTEGWGRKINYSMKEYKDLYERTQSLRQRLQVESGNTVKAIDLEKMAYAIGKQAQQRKEVGVADEDDEPLRPPSPKRRKKEASPDSDDPIYVCLRKGPTGSPTYDGFGHELDYDKIVKREKLVKQVTGPKPFGIGNRDLTKFERMRDDDKRKAEILGLSDEKRDNTNFLDNRVARWDDRVARDLGIPFHEVGMEEYETWKQRGFKVEPGEFENPSEEELDRVMQLMFGSALRKGSKQR